MRAEEIEPKGWREKQTFRNEDMLIKYRENSIFV